LKKIQHISFSKSGGAGTVAHRLQEYQSRFLEYESKFLFDFHEFIKTDSFKDLSLTSRAIIDNKIIKKYDQKVLLSLFRNRENLQFFDLIKSYSGITHLHWINGIIDFNSLSKLVKLNKKLVWTIHDMEPFTGGCHYSLDCDQLSKSCIRCPIVYPIFRRSIRNQFQTKKTFYMNHKSIFYTFPSNWMQKQFNLAFPDVEIRSAIVANPISSIFFESNIDVKSISTSPLNDLMVGFVSTSLNDPLKRFNFVVRMLKKVSESTNRSITLVAIGMPTKINTFNSKIKIIQPGLLSEEKTILSFYESMDILISASLSESFGLSIAEAGALGIPSIVQNGSGSSEIIIDGLNGLVANDEAEFISKLIEFSTNFSLREKLSNNIKTYAKENWHIAKIASRYDEIYSELD
jgi:glycosyltransferase involved in cell wall biosynthesis